MQNIETQRNVLGHSNGKLTRFPGEPSPPSKWVSFETCHQLRRLEGSSGVEPLFALYILHINYKLAFETLLDTAEKHQISLLP